MEDFIPGADSTTYEKKWDIIIPVTDSTTFETGSNFKGAGECDLLRNNTGRIFKPTNNTSGGIRPESKQGYLEVDPNKTPPEATPPKQPPPEIDKILEGSRPKVKGAISTKRYRERVC